MAECPSCGAEHSHDELELLESYSTSDSTYAVLECPSCGEGADYSEWGAFSDNALRLIAVILWC